MSLEVQSDVTELRGKLDKMTDKTIKTALGFIHDMAIEMADDNGKVDLDELLKALSKQEMPIHEWIADKYEWELGSIEDHLTQIESELDELQELYEQPEHSDFLHELAANISELVKYGSDKQKVQYLENLDDCEELKEFGGESSLILSGTQELVI